MPHAHWVLYLHPLAIFEKLAQERVILDMDAYMCMRQPWSGIIVLCYVGFHHHVGHACWDGILQGFSTTYRQLSSWQVRIAWYPISIRNAGRCGLNWAGLSFNLQAAVILLLNLDWSIICLYLQRYILMLFPILTIKTVLKENNALAI